MNLDRACTEIFPQMSYEECTRILCAASVIDCSAASPLFCGTLRVPS